MKKGLSLFLALLMVVLVFSPAFPSLGIVASAASTFPVELAFNNLFIFEDWATNSLSSTVIVDGVAQSKDANLLETDIENGSFTLTKENMDAGETYTAFLLDTTDAVANSKYYMMDVEPDTEYIFSYHVTGNTYVFTPYIFYYDQNGLWIENAMNAFATPQYETNNMRFTTPANAGKIQIRWTIGDSTGTSVGNTGASSVYATVKNIAIYKADIYDTYFAAEEAELAAQKEAQNLFEFDAWADKATSLPCGLGTTGDIAPDTVNDTVKFTTSANASDSFFTPLGIDTVASNVGFYTVAVSPNTGYSFTYDIGDNTLPGAVHCQPWIVEMNSSGVALNYFNYETPGLTNNRKDFTTSADTTQIQIVFNIINDATAVSRYCVVENIGVYETSFLNSLPSINYSVDFETITGHTHRQAYSYTTGSSDNGTYGELPTPSYVPENYVFAGWYTGKDGTGEYISADTEVSYSSYTVYPKFEPKVDTLTITTPPSKIEYTLGEKLNTAGLVLTATINYVKQEDTDNDGVVDTETPAVNTFNITSGYRCTPEYLTAEGTQAITVEYGGMTATFNVNVSPYNEKNITVNGATHPVTVANNNYTIEYSGTPFNRYELNYYSDSYVKGVITMDADTEEFFLEPSDNGHFASYIDSFLRGIQHYSVVSIEFTCLDNEYGNFELFSVTTIDSPVPSDPTQYYQNDEYKVGISLDYGGVVSYIEDLDDDVSAAVYNENGKDITRVDYTSKLPSGATATSNSVNLINTNDRGRYLQQSYYGTDQPPYEMGSYNGIPWSYNPVQGGNISTFDSETGEVIKGAEASKVIDYRITADQIYIKTRPLDWGKNSEDYPDSYITDSYMEAWYTFENGMIKTTCRFVDYSGYPSNTTTQEYPALYTIEPLNHFVYNETTEAQAWEAASIAWQTDGMTNIEEPDFWGVLPEYNALLKANGMSEVDVDVDCYENWAAFTASADTDSFGIGVYSAGITDFHYGVFPAIYNEDQVKQGNLVANYRHAASLDPAIESPTSYISPVGTMTFESYKPSTYSFYVTTGTADQIREDFRKVESIESGEALAQTKVAVPETVYMAPANGASTVGEIYVNNVLDVNDFYNVTTLAEREDNMYFGIHIADAAYFTVDVSNATDPSNDINLCTTSGSAVSTTQQFAFVDGNYINDGQYELRFSGAGLNPGEKATAKWDITVTMNDGSTQKYAYYTVMYAPERTVGAVAEARQVDNSQNEISSWITGANGVDHSKWSPLASFHADKSAVGYFKEDPLIYDAPLTAITSTGETATDLINVVQEYPAENTKYDNAYVMQTATSGNDDSTAKSYLGLLTVDKSRYTNTNQIPNLKIGYDALRRGSWTKDSFNTYGNYYTLGTADAFTSTDPSATPGSDWTQERYFTNFAESNSIPERYTVIPSYDVSDIDGKYIHALNKGQAIQDFVLYVEREYSTAGTSVLCSVTDKSGLRDTVLTGYGVTDTNPEFDEALENAATVLGDPSATQEEIDNAKKELNDAMQEKVDTYYALKYDNIFSVYEFSQKSDSMKVVSDRGTATYSNGALTVVNETITGGEAYTNYGSADGYYHVDLKPNTEYVFEYDVTTDLKAQAFMFFYNSTGGNGDVPTNISVQTNGGQWVPRTESNSWWGNYTNSAGTYHYAIRFTTGANTVKAGFRFGNTSNDPVTSTFSNIKLVDAAHYYANATYSKTEELFKEYTSYGAMITPVRPGYTLSGWQDANGVAVTGADIATEHKSIYSVWNENSYTVNYDKNGDDVIGSADAKIFKYTQEFTLPDDFSRDYYMFKGWAYEADATAPVFTPGQTISFEDIQADKIDSNNQVTLYAVWEKGYSLYYSPNNGTGELAGTFKGYTEPHTIKENTTITREGYTFLGWSLDQNATAPGYYAGDELTVSAIDSKYIQKDANNELQTYVVLHAVWSEHKYGIAFNANGGSGEMAAMPNIGYDDGTTLTANSFTKEGYTFNGWNTAANGSGTSYADKENVSKLTADDNANVTLYAQWKANSYTVRFNANTGSGTMSDLAMTYDVAKNLTANAFTKEGYAFMGWSTTPDGEVVYKNGDSVKNLTATNGEVVNLYAVWAQPTVNVTFDNLVDISAWSDNVNNGTLVNDSDIGFTVKSNADAGEATCSSAYFPITAGEKYVVEADIKGTGWDIYVFFCDDAGNWVEFNDGTNRFSSDGRKNVAETNGIHVKSIEFTAPTGATKVQLRVDANNANNAVRFENIRAYNVKDATYLETVNKYVNYSNAYGKLPVPVKEGQQFLGWVDGNGNMVTADSIMNSTSTVYLKSTWTVNSNTANDDTVVIEYGLPVVIDLLSNDKGGTVTGIGKNGVSDSDLGKVSHPSSILTDKASSLTLTNGTAELDNNGKVTYTPSKTNVAAEEVFFYEVSVDGVFYYAKVTIIPATTIYFEDTFFTFEDSTVTKNGTTYNYNWQNLGTSVGEVFQSADRPGAFNFADDANNVYEYDSVYDSKVSYSGGTAHFVEVDQIAGTAAPKAVFTFTGTGFDLFSVTDNKSGTVTVTIYSGTEVDSSKRVQGIMSNAYFGYSYDSENDSYITSDNGALFQVPLIRARDLGYGTYTVVVSPRYNKAFDVAGTGKAGVYVDSVRIYDPMGSGNATANDAYMADGEFAPQFLEIRDTLVSANDDGTFNISDLGQGKSVFLDGGRTSMDDFAKLGPKNEVYLQNGNSVAFHIVTDRADLPSTIQIGMSLAGKNGTSADVKLMNSDYNSWVENITLNSTSERYYNIEAVVDWVEQTDGTYKTASPVIVTNTSDAIVSLTSLKWAFNSEESVATELNLMSDMDTPELAKAAIMRMANPQVTPQQTILNRDNITYSFSGEPYAPGDFGILTITTEQGVSGVTVNGTDVFDCELNSDGKLEWSYEFTAEAADSMTFEIIARDENGFTSESIYATADIDNNTDDNDNEATEPDGDESDDTTDDSGNNNVVTGPESFVTTLLNGIFNIIRKLLGAILGGATV